MRLTTYEIKCIQNVFHKLKVELKIEFNFFLTGSRTDPKKKGGDIDLLVITENAISLSKIKDQKEKILVQLKDLLGDQKIDLTLADHSIIQNNPILSSMADKAIQL